MENLKHTPGTLTTKKPGPPASTAFPSDVELWHDDEYIGLMPAWIADELMKRWTAKAPELRAMVQRLRDALDEATPDDMHTPNLVHEADDLLKTC